MSFRVLACVGSLLLGLGGQTAWAQSEDSAPPQLFLELNAAQDVAGACRLTFVARNATGLEIEQAVFETVIFDAAGGVISLSLYDFRDLPSGRPRVRQFDVPGIACDGLGQALINGANACRVEGVENGVCDSSLMLSSRLAMGLIG